MENNNNENQYPSEINNLNIDDNNEQFIKAFKELEKEPMFKDNIIEFLNKMISKIENISNFGIFLELINLKIKIIDDDDFFFQLKDKFDDIKWQIDSFTDEQLNKAIKIIANFFDLIYIHEKNCNFIKKQLNELDKNINFLIYKELIRRCKADEYKEMKEFIYIKFLNRLDNTKNIIDLIDILDKKDKKVFLEELMKKCLFTKEEYYSNNENQKILLLCKLNEKLIFKIIEEDINYQDIVKILQSIRKDLEGDIEIKKLKEFLDNEEKLILNKLGLIKKNFE